MCFEDMQPINREEQLDQRIGADFLSSMPAKKEQGLMTMKKSPCSLIAYAAHRTLQTDGV